MKKPKGTYSPAGAEIIGALSEFRDAIRAKIPIEQKFTVRTVELDLEARVRGGRRPEDEGDSKRQSGHFREVSWCGREYSTLLGAGVEAAVLDRLSFHGRDCALACSLAEAFPPTDHQTRHAPCGNVTVGKGALHRKVLPAEQSPLRRTEAGLFLRNNLKV